MQTEHTTITTMAIKDATDRIEAWAYGLAHLASHAEGHRSENMLSVLMEEAVAKDCHLIRAVLNGAGSPPDAGERVI